MSLDRDTFEGNTRARRPGEILVDASRVRWKALFFPTIGRLLTVFVGYDVRIDVIDRLLGLRVHWGGCTGIRRLAHDGSVLWTPGSAGEVLPAERHHDYSYGQDQKGRRGCQAQQQRIQHRCVGVACRDSRCKMLDQLELLSIIPRIPTNRAGDATHPFRPILHSVQRERVEVRASVGSAISNLPPSSFFYVEFLPFSSSRIEVVSTREREREREGNATASPYFSITLGLCRAAR